MPTQTKSADAAKRGASRWTGDSKELPRAALHFRSECKFADAVAGKDGDGATVPFTMTARTGDPIEHWYWGKVVHDMNGMTLSKPTLAVDYCHDQDEILGFADQFDTKTGDLVVSGAVIPTPEDPCDRAGEVLRKQKLGVPYEASIDFSGDVPVIEYIPMDATIEVNGKEFAGPGVVIREWTLRALAICPYGADSNTTTEFSASSDKVTVIAINSPKGGTQMSQANTPEKKNDAPVTPVTPAPAGQLTQGTPAGEVKPQDRYINAFGATGAQWFLENKPFEDCTREFTAQLNTKHAAEVEALKTQFTGEKVTLQTQLDAANAKLAAIGRGDKGVTFSNADGGNVDPKAAQLNSNIGPNLTRFATGIKMPGAKTPEK